MLLLLTVEEEEDGMTLRKADFLSSVLDILEVMSADVAVDNGMVGSGDIRLFVEGMCSDFVIEEEG